MAVKTVEELDKIAQGFILGDFNPLEVYGLNLFDNALVMNLAAAYSCVKIGTLSPMDCARIKLKLFNEYQYYRRRVINLEKAHDTWVKNTRELDVDLTLLTKLLRDEAAAPAEITKKALGLLDAITGENILLKFFHKYQSDEKFMKHSVDTLVENDEHFTERFGNDIPYVPLLEAFIAGAREDGFAEMFRQLDMDELKKLAGKNIPVRKEPSECKVVAESIKEMFMFSRRI